MAVRPVAVPGDYGPVGDPPVRRVRHHLPGHQRGHVHRGRCAAHPPQLVAGPDHRRDLRPGGRGERPVRAPLPGAVPAGPGPAGRPGHLRRGGGHRDRGAQGARAPRRGAGQARRPGVAGLPDPAGQGAAARLVLGHARPHPERGHRAHRARRRHRHQQAHADAGRPGRVHHAHPGTGLADRGDGLHPGQRPGGGHGGTARVRDSGHAARRCLHARRGCPGRGQRAGPAPLRPGGVRLPGGGAPGAARGDAGPGAGPDPRADRRDRLRQDHAAAPGPAAGRPDGRVDHPERHRHPRPAIAGAARPDRQRVRRSHPVLGERAGKRHPGCAGRRRRADRAGPGDRPRRFRVRAAVGAGHQDRGAGHGAVRRPAAAPGAGPGHPGPAAAAGPRRPAVRAGRAHRGEGDRRAAPGARRDDRPAGGAPPVHGAARRPGGPAGRGQDRRRRHARGTARHRAPLRRADGRRASRASIAGQRRGGGVMRQPPSTPQAPGRTPDTAPHASLRGPGAEDRPPAPLDCAPPARPCEAPAREADWRGIAAENVELVTGKLSALLRRRARRLLASLLRPYRRQVAWALVLIIVGNVAALAGPWLVGVAIDQGIPPLVHSRDVVPLAVIIAAVAVQAVTTRAFILEIGRFGEGAVRELRRRLFAHFQRLPVAFHERYTSGRVISRQTSDIDSITDLFEEGLDSLVSAAFSLLLVGAGMLLLDWPLALVVLAGFGPLALLTLWFRRESAIAYRRSREAIADVIVAFVETFGGIRAVQAFRRERRNEEIFSVLNGRNAAATLRSMRLIAVYSPGITLVGNLAAGAVLLYGGLRVANGDIKVGVLATFLLYLQRFFDPLQDLSQFYNTFQSAGAALEKISGVLDEPPGVPEPEVPAELPARNGAGRELRLRSVRFGYRETIVLPDMDVRIPAGQTVALVGETGAGKTTVARLVARFYDPGEGSVLLDGTDLRDLPADRLRSEVVLVTQENFLFTGSIADNIELGKPGASRAEIVGAATAIGADAFIAALPGGYDAQVGKRGGRLSAGQRQLISFARAFLAAPAVLVLDEATSLLDLPSERAVQAALRTILAGRTALIIAHRLSTVAIADRVLVMSGGQIVEDGPPDLLLAGSGRYSALHASWQSSLA